MGINKVISIEYDGILLLGWKSCIQDMKFKICQVSKSIPAAKSQNFVNISGAHKPTWAKFFGIWFFFMWEDMVT